MHSMSPADQTSNDDVYGVSGRSEWLDVDWTAQQRWLHIDDRAVNVIELGSGPPLLFVHGLSGCWQNWLENLPHFARTHRAIALDLPGFGASPMPPWEITIPAYGRFVRDFCELLGIDCCSIVGNSMGGFIATELAITEPERIDDLTLVSAAGITWARARREPAEMLARVGRAAAPLALRFQKSGIRRPRYRRRAFRGVFHDPDALRLEM